ncbi:hypothetical protein D3C87_464200 [compost metagenome]
MKIILSVLNVILISSCSFIHYMGTKTTVDKPESEINTYLIKNNFTFYDYNLLLKDELIDSLSIKKQALNLWQFEHGTAQSTIQLRIYDSLGKLVNGYAQCYGDFKKLNILSEKPYRTFSHLPNNFDLRLKNDLILWNITESDQQELLAKASEKKYTLVVYWNMWSNYYSKIILKELRKYLQKYQMKKEVLIILVNTDYSIVK